MTGRDSFEPKLFEKYLSVQAAAARLDVSEGTVRNWVSAGTLVPDGTLNGQLRFLPETLDAMVKPWRPARGRGHRLRGKAPTKGATNGV